MNKQEIKQLLLNDTYMDIMDKDDEIKKIEDIGYNCLEITINNAVYQMGFEYDF